MKKIIITGAAGLVGLNLLMSIKNSGYEIIAIDKNQNNLQLIKKLKPRTKILCADLSLKDKKWGKLFENVHCVIQLQAQISDPKKFSYIKNNIDSVRNILEACKKYNIKNLIHVSSSVALSIARDYYTNTKIIGEKLVRESKIPHTILRPSIMYGCFDIKHLGFIVENAEKFIILPFPGKGDYIRQPLYVVDFVKIIINLIEREPKRRTYNIIGKEKLYFIDLIKIILKEKNKKRILLRLPIPFFLSLMKGYTFLTNKDPYVPDQLKALTAGDIFPVANWEKEFGVKYTKFREGVKEMINSEYYKYGNLMKK